MKKMCTLWRWLLIGLVSALIPSACQGMPTPTLMPPTVTPTLTAPTVLSVKSFSSGVYRNLFKEYLNKSDAETQEKIDAVWKQLFYGNDTSERIYYPVGDEMAYIADIGNGDVRSEGMSYGMMIAVQLNKQAEFDRIWKWTKTYMYQSDGPYKGYFAWHCATDGKKLDPNPASDGEEWFATALLFAANRWGGSYQAEAQAILDVMLHKEDANPNNPGAGSDLATNMFNKTHKMVVFVPQVGPASSFSDPSYHLPAYYELWARWADKDNQFWAEAAQTSRVYFHKAAHPKTGLMADYANFDGTPYGADDHKDFRFDAWRTLSNVAVDYAWFGVDPWQVEQSNRVLDFLAAQGVDSFGNQFALDGTPLSSDHSTGLVASAATAALAADPAKGKPFVQALWDTQTPTGKWRYYDGLLYLLALLHVGGNFQIYLPAS